MVGEQHIEVRIAANERDMQGAFAVRREVFIVEQGVPEELERDEADDSAVHVVASAGSAAIGTARLEAEAQRLGMAETSLHAQTYVQALYERHGYAVTGPGFVEAGIDHVPMSKRLG